MPGGTSIGICCTNAPALVGGSAKLPCCSLAAVGGGALGGASVSPARRLPVRAAVSSPPPPPHPALLATVAARKVATIVPYADRGQASICRRQCNGRAPAR